MRSLATVSDAGPAPMQTTRVPFLLGRNHRQPVGDIAPEVGRHALQAADRDRGAVDARPPARGLAGPVTGSPKDPREDVGFAVGHVRVRVPALGDQADVLGDVRVGRAGPLAVHDPMEVIRVRRVSWVHKMVWIPGLGPCCLHGDTAAPTCDVRRHSASPVRAADTLSSRWVIFATRTPVSTLMRATAPSA